jgi:uncharacterized protein (DUF983 family)
MSQGERCPGCRQGRLISRALGFRECTNVECYYTTAGHPEHDPEPSPEPVWGMTEKGRQALAAIDQRNLEIAEGRVKAERTCPQCGMGRLHTSGYIEGQAVCFECGFRVMGLNESRQIAAEREAADAEERVLRGLTHGLMPRKDAAIEKLNRELLVLGAPSAPNPEAEVTELERLRCLVKTLEQEAQTLREVVAEWNQRLAIARGQTAEWKKRYTAERGMLQSEWQSAKLDTELYAEKLDTEKSEHLSTRLKLVTALADLQALREKRGEPETERNPERGIWLPQGARTGDCPESRLANVASFEFHRGARITCSEED